MKGEGIGARGNPLALSTIFASPIGAATDDEITHGQTAAAKRPALSCGTREVFDLTDYEDYMLHSIGKLFEHYLDIDGAKISVFC